MKKKAVMIALCLLAAVSACGCGAEQKQEMTLEEIESNKKGFTAGASVHDPSILEVDGEITEYARIKANNIAEYIETEKLVPGITTEQIGDLVENGLMSCKRKDVAKKYVLERDERSRTRGNTTDKTINEIVNGTSAY